MKIRLILLIIVLHLPFLFRVNAQIISNIDPAEVLKLSSKHGWKESYAINEPKIQILPCLESSLPYPLPPPTCITNYISLEAPFAGFTGFAGDATHPVDNGFVGHYSQDNITATNICDYYSSIHPKIYSTNENGNNIGFEKGNFDHWVKIIGNNHPDTKILNHKCGQLSFWRKSNILGDDEIKRFGIIDRKGFLYIDQYVNQSLYINKVSDYSNRFLIKLGDNGYDRRGNIIFRKIRIYKNNPIIKYNYALVMGNYPHTYCDAPYFRAIFLDKNCQIIECASHTVNAKRNGSKLLPTDIQSYDFLDLQNSSAAYDFETNNFRNPAFGKYLPWTSNTIDASIYFVDQNATYEDFTIAFITSACAGNMDMGYAYIDVETGVNPITISSVKACINEDMQFFGPTDNYDGESYVWNFGDGTTDTSKNPTHKYASTGIKNCTLTVTVTPPSYDPLPPCCSTYVFYSQIVVNDCSNGYIAECPFCINSFRPEPGKYYVLSAWVKQEKADIDPGGSGIAPKLTYNKANIKLTFTVTGSSPPVQTFYPEGPIIDGWQRIEQKFLVPGTISTATNMEIKLDNPAGSSDAYFDDIRIFPFDGNMKSFVYDPVTQKLVAELDENNYASYYEYDEEGALIRVKKETERGVMTIKEHGNNKPKRSN